MLKSIHNTTYRIYSLSKPKLYSSKSKNPTLITLSVSTAFSELVMDPSICSVPFNES